MPNITIMLTVIPMTERKKKAIMKEVGIAKPTSRDERMPRAATQTIITNAIAVMIEACREPRARKIHVEASSV